MTRKGDFYLERIQLLLEQISCKQREFDEWYCFALFGQVKITLHLKDVNETLERICGLL